MSDEFCPMTAIRDGIEEPCDKPAVCMVRYEFDGRMFVDPACSYHAHQIGGAVQITTHIADLIRTQDRIRREPVGASLTCCICTAPAHTVYAEGPEIAAYCALCDRIGAEDCEES